MTNGTPQHPALTELLREQGFNGDSLFHRRTLAEFLTPTEDPEVFLLSANDDPSEGVVDVYEAGHSVLAANVGPGLAFTASRAEDWAGDDRVLVEVRLADVLDQGGRVYPVDTVITEAVWYFTLPSGSVRVRRVP
jgi:hypothetical protein